MSRPLTIAPIKTEIFQLKQNLFQFITESLKEIEFKDESILVITSKIVSLSESRTVAKSSVKKDDLIHAEADYDLGELAYDCRLTIKHGLFIPSAGIDESNSAEDNYILFPQDPFASAQKIHSQLLKHYNLNSLGVIISDSHSLPLRRGVTGIALSHWGFAPVKNLVGRKDLFNKPLKFTKINLADGLASAAVLLMGEADDACPLALIENAPVEFCDKTSAEEIQIPIEQDLYYPIYKERLIANN